MGKKSNRKRHPVDSGQLKESPEFLHEVEDKFKSILKVMGWIVGVCFTLIIVLPNFDFLLVDSIVKFVYYLGIINLILFAIMEIFNTQIKKLLSKKYT